MVQLGHISHDRPSRLFALHRSLARWHREMCPLPAIHSPLPSARTRSGKGSTASHLPLDLLRLALGLPRDLLRLSLDLCRLALGLSGDLLRLALGVARELGRLALGFAGRFLRGALGLLGVEADGGFEVFGRLFCEERGVGD